jgi:hypothetical protein
MRNTAGASASGDNQYANPRRANEWAVAAANSMRTMTSAAFAATSTSPQPRRPSNRPTANPTWAPDAARCLTMLMSSQYERAATT